MCYKGKMSQREQSLIADDMSLVIKGAYGLETGVLLMDMVRLLKVVSYYCPPQQLAYP